MEFGVLIKAFEFEKALMQEHFNENYMESDKYPKSTFVGKIDNLSEVKFEKDGVYTAKISGDLTIHGVTKKVNTTGTFTVKSGAVKGDATFMVLLEDYKIAIPAVVKDKVSKDIKVVVDVNLTRFGAK